MLRQGDIMFRESDEQVKGKTVKRLVIAEGEQTGHSHLLIAESESMIKGDKTLFSVSGKARLIHPDHDTIKFKSGTYTVIKEREFDYIENTLKQVVD